ncbi:MAG: translocation/assembly module TamB domain-containing protein, partial [Deltaproteobacteria bacterium]|nr:translocation/assembly module TamB domain-containing protein [Deltaproteobacteria bacterium]
PKGWRRALRITGRIAGGLVALIVLAVIFLHTPWGKSVVRARIEAKLGALVNGKVAVGDLDYGFLFSSIEIGKLEIRDATDRPAIAIDAIAIDLDRGELLGGALVIDELAIAGVSANVIKNADGTTNLTGLFKPSDRKPLKQLKINKLSVTGAATITKPDGSTIAIRDLGIAGTVEARPIDKELDVAIDSIVAKLDITKLDSKRTVDIALGGIVAKRRIDAVDLDIAKLAVGALGIEALGAHVKLADGKPHGQQTITLGKAKIDSKQLTEMLGREVLIDDVALDLSITGPENKLVVHGAVKTGSSSLTIDGNADISSSPGKQGPSYDLAIVGKGRSGDVTRKAKLAVETDLRIDIKGAGISPLDLDTAIEIVVGPTKVGQIALDGLTAKASAKHGAYKLERLNARGVEFEIAASADVAADKTLAGRISISGSPAKAMKVLAAAGIAIPAKVPAIGRVDLQLTAAGKLDGELVAELAPTRIGIAGGFVALAGTATLDNKKLRVATTKVELSKLDLASLAHLAGRPVKATGTLNGTIALTKTPTDRHVDFGFAVGLRNKPLSITAKGAADLTSATAHVEVRHSGNRSLLAALDAKLPLDAQGFQPRGTWRVTADVANRQLSELAALLGKTLPAGDIAIHADIAGSPAQPTGSIAITANAAVLKNVPGKQKIALRATLRPTAGGLVVGTTGSIALANQSPLAAISGSIAMPFVWNGKQLDRAGLRAGLSIDTVIDIPERPLASLGAIRARLADLGGTIGGRITARGPAKTPAIDAAIHWRGYKNAAGTFGETKISATGTPLNLSATINHGNALVIFADIDRSKADRISIKTRARSAKTPLLPLLPALLAGKIGANEPGSLHWNMDGNIVLAKTDSGMQVDLAAITGSLDLTGGSLKLPSTNRRYRDIGLAVVAEPAGLRIKSLSLHETDLEKRDRKLSVSGLVTLDKLKAKKVELSLTARDWLVFGGDKFGMADAPRATATFDIGVAVDLASPVIGIDATVHALSLRSPDRLERGHYVEKASVSGDIIVVDQNTKLGRLAVAAVPTAAKKRRAMDIRIHIPKAIRLDQTPMDVMARGDITVAIRDSGIVTRGKLTMDRGKLNLFGRDHALTEGSLTFSEQHPQGFLALTFERKLPDVAMRDLKRSAGGARVTFNGSPSKPKTSLSGSANAAMFEVMAMYNAGRPTSVARPGLPTSSLVQAPRGDQLFMLTFMASNLPHLLFLDRINAWADPYASSYGQIANLEAEKYSRDQKSRVKAVVRPNTPGRSNAELQYDRMLINNDRAAVGVGVRAGDRLGGGVGVFVEWSSKE